MSFQIDSVGIDNCGFSARLFVRYLSSVGELGASYETDQVGVAQLTDTNGVDSWVRRSAGGRIRSMQVQVSVR